MCMFYSRSRTKRFTCGSVFNVQLKWCSTQSILGHVLLLRSNTEWMLWSRWWICLNHPIPPSTSTAFPSFHPSANFYLAYLLLWRSSICLRSPLHLFPCVTTFWSKTRTCLFSSAKSWTAGFAAAFSSPCLPSKHKFEPRSRKNIFCLLRSWMNSWFCIHFCCGLVSAILRLVIWYRLPVSKRS